jgi:primosomal protein N' (replication factor Y)
VTVEVVVPGVSGGYSYGLRADMAKRARPGQRVLVSFGRRRTTGFLVSLHEKLDPRATKAILEILDSECVFDENLLRFTKWMADYYLCPWGDVLKAALPAGITLDEQRRWVLEAMPESEKWRDYSQRHPDAQRVVDALSKGPLTPEALRRALRATRFPHEVRLLREAGIISLRPVLLPPRVKSKMEAIVSVAEEKASEDWENLLAILETRSEQRVLRDVLEAGPEGILRAELLKGATSARRQALGKLLAKKILKLSLEEVSRWDPEREHAPEIVAPTQLTDAQKKALTAILPSLSDGKFRAFLLYGVTGSGKTQVYIEAIKELLRLGKTALVLVPEIALTPHLWARFRAAFGDRVAIQHSAQSPAVRYDLWRGILRGDYPVVIGARSAVFAPLKKLGLVVVDEEQEATYKQEEPDPRYHARDAALMRAHFEGAVAVLGSATPSMETLYQVRQERYELLTLPERVGGSVMPQISVVSRQQEDGKEIAPLSDELVAEIQAILASGDQAILLQNRRGYAPFLMCHHCGFIPGCPDCAVSLTYHRRGRSLRCHYCDKREEVPETCPRCSSTDLAYEGVGTQRLEEELALHFPQARLLRMDLDTTTRRGAHGRMIAAFAAGDYDILLGTQMVAKGLDFPGVQLVGVVSADTELFHPDFRAAERGSALLTQASGRAGRRERMGKVLVQTFVPEHPVVKTVCEQDWFGFAEQELPRREAASFPPFARLVLVRFSGKDESKVAKAALRFRSLVKSEGGVETLGPAPAVLYKLRGKIRYHLLVRSLRARDESGATLRRAVKQARDEFHRTRAESGVEIEMDVDPVGIA